MMARIVFVALLTLLALAAPGSAQSRQPTAKEVAAVRDCAAKNQDNIDAGEQQCLFNLVATPCINGNNADAAMADCYEIEGAIWDQLLNENYKALLGTLDDTQTGQARTMQRAWIAYRASTCGFYDDKIRGSNTIMIHAARVTRESARRAMLLQFFSRL